MPELRVRIDFYYRAYLLRIACRVALRRKWQHLTASLLHEALEPLARGHPADDALARVVEALARSGESAQSPPPSAAGARSPVA